MGLCDKHAPPPHKTTCTCTSHALPCLLACAVHPCPCVFTRLCCPAVCPRGLPATTRMPHPTMDPPLTHPHTPCVRYCNRASAAAPAGGGGPGGAGQIGCSQALDGRHVRRVLPAAATSTHRTRTCTHPSPCCCPCHPTPLRCKLPRSRCRNIAPARARHELRHRAQPLQRCSATIRGSAGAGGGRGAGRRTARCRRLCRRRRASAASRRHTSWQWAESSCCRALPSSARW